EVSILLSTTAVRGDRRRAGADRYSTGTGEQPDAGRRRRLPRRHGHGRAVQRGFFGVSQRVRTERDTRRIGRAADEHERLEQAARGERLRELPGAAAALRALGKTLWAR